MRLIDFFDRGVTLAPDRICIEDGLVRRTYAQVQRRSCQIANALAIEGFEPGMKAGMLSPNCAVGFEVMLGLFRSGVAWVPVNSANPIEENCRIFDGNDTEILFFHSQFEPSIDEIRQRCPKLRQLICLDQKTVAAVGLEEWIGHAADTDPDHMLGPDAMVAIVSSGGTTGTPKGIVHTQLNWATVIANIHATIDLGPDPVHLVVTPISHAAGVLAIAMLSVGARNVILPRFDPVHVLDAIKSEHVTHLFLPPTAIYMLLAQPGLAERRFPSLRGLVYAGAPMAVDKLRQCLAIFGPVMIQTYGQAEAPMVCTIMTAQEHEVADDPARVHRLASCGRATLLTPVAIMDDEGKLLPRGSRGEVVVRGNLVMQGYYNNPQATEQVSQHGWHHTGDIGLIDDDGYVYIVDRKKDMVISGGFNIYPGEIEQLIWSHPGVQDCAVIGVPDEKWGEAVKAIIEPLPGASIDADEVIAYCKAQLGSIKAPKSVEIWDSLPRTPTGKVSKKDIREIYWAGESRRV